MKVEPEKLVRGNIRKLIPYSSARHEFKGEASVFLDANENSFGSPLNENYNRYPDPQQLLLKSELAIVKAVSSKNIFIGNGSDEVIDLVYRIFCNPGIDNIIICPPTYGMYQVSGNINDVEVRKVNLTNEFQLDVESILCVADKNTKLLFICSPNNPTGNNMNIADIESLLHNFAGIVIIDEAYIDFSKQKSFVNYIKEYENLIVMQTLSKAWGLAALRVGLAFSSLRVIELLNKVKPPYNSNRASQELAIMALQNTQQVKGWLKQNNEQKEILNQELAKFSFVKKIHASDSNFLLVEVNDANELYNYLLHNKIVVRNRSKEVLCDNCLRITVGTPVENNLLLNMLKEYT